MDIKQENGLKRENDNMEVDNEKKQLARSLLREKFLRAISGLVGKECSLHMYSNTNVSGIFKGCDIEFENLLVEKLKTPYTEIPHSMIRSSDVNYIVFDNISTN